jgi:hypothetical protein
MRLVVLALVLCGCAATAPPTPPSADQAQAFLKQVVDTAKSGDFEALCELGGGSCQDYLDLEGGHQVPAAPPVIVGERVLQPSGTNSGRVGGRVLELCGLMDQGEVYYSEMLVFFDHNGKLVGIEPEYWMGIRISDDDSAGQHIGEDVPSVCHGAVLGPVYESLGEH